MTRIVFPFALLVTTLVCLFPAASAQAQAARTFVSAAGSDSNNCINVATPCRHFAPAYAATAANASLFIGGVLLIEPDLSREVESVRRSADDGPQGTNTAQVGSDLTYCE